MKLFKVICSLLLIAALVLSIAVLGQSEREDRLYLSGEISRDEMTEFPDLLSQVGVIIALFACGGFGWLISNEIEKTRSMDD